MQKMPKLKKNAYISNNCIKANNQFKLKKIKKDRD